MHRKPSWLLATAVCICLITFADRSVAQVGGDKPKAQAPTTGTRIITLGTAGGPLPRKGRAQSSNLLVVNGIPYLIDAGEGVTRRIVQSGSNFMQVRKIFITHPHSDHTTGLATLLVCEWMYQRHDPV